MFSRIINAVKSSYGGLPRSVYILFVSRVINRVGGFVHAFMAAFMKTYLNWSTGEIANYVLFAGIVTMIGPFIGGSVADSNGRKSIYVVCTTLGALLFVPAGYFALNQPDLVPYFLIAASFLHSMVGPVNSAMVADICTDPLERKRAFALLYLGINVGVAIGPMIGGLLLANHVQWFFYGDAITTLISIFLIALFVKETKMTNEEMQEVTGDEKMEHGHPIMVFLKKPIIVMFTFFSLFNSFVYAQSGFGFSLHMIDQFGDERGAMFFGTLMSFNAITVLVCTIGLTELLKRNKPIFNISLASVLYIIGFGMKGFIGDIFWLYFISVFIWTIGEIIAVTNQSVFIMNHTPVNFRGRFNAIIGFLMGVGYVVSPKIMSYFIDNFSFSVAWQVVAFAAAVASIGLFFTGVMDNRLHEGKSTVQE